MSHQDKVAGMRRNLQAKTGKTVGGRLILSDRAAR